MLYQLHEWQSAALVPFRLMAEAGQEWLRHPLLVPTAHTPLAGTLATALELFELATRSHRKPDFGIERVAVDGAEVAVREEAVVEKPFCTLRRFACEREEEAPRALVVAPLTGHFATQMRDMVGGLLPGHDVYLTDWVDAREVPLEEGDFRLDDYVAYVIEFLRRLGPEAHVLAVCQATVPVLAAVSLLAAEGDPAEPRGMVLFGGPIDTRVNPTAIDEVATDHPLSWFESTQVATVPAHYPGAGRRVHPGFIQRATFLAMNADRLVEVQLRLLRHRLAGEGEEAEACRRFYEEYLAVMDLPAEFYLDTVRTVFQERALARGTLAWGGRRVEPAAIRRCALLTVEGGRDEVAGRGQTEAAHDLCPNIPRGRRRRLLDADADHVALFTGRVWRERIFPRVRDFLRA